MATSIYKCPNCDAGLKFSPSTQDFACEFCHSHFTEQQMQEIGQAKASAQQRPPEEATASQQAAPTQQAATAEEPLLLYTCPTCGAEISTDATTAATYCYYCHNPVVLTGQLDGAYRPSKLIPFAFDRATAQNSFLNWVKKKKFVPAGFFSKDQIEKINGVYFPYWLVDSDVQASLTATARTVRVWRVGNIQHTETKHYRIARGGRIHFEDISKNALRKENSILCNGVHPYNSQGVRDYMPAFLSGFFAEKRNVEAGEVQQEVMSDVQKFSQQVLRNTISGYGSVTVEHCALNGCNLHWDHALLPVWTVTYKGSDGKIYFYTMNGQTGKTTGVLPLDKGKLLLTLGGIALGVGLILGIILLGGWLF